LRFADGSFRITFNIEEDEIGVVLLDEYFRLHTGMRWDAGDM
jgi:F-type H+/Na+-transporting ATPase subunit alpha